jgi:hypothetical protein
MNKATSCPAEPDRRELHAWARGKVESLVMNVLLTVVTEYLALAAWQARCTEREAG